jgi:hypothetical protein
MKDRARPPRTRTWQGRHVALVPKPRGTMEDGRGVLGRAWLNGREVGGTEARFGHLARSHD